MARTMMTKEVTKTTVKVAKIEVEKGAVNVVELPEETLLGNVNLERAQRVLNKKLGQAVTILELKPDTQVYEMPVEEFIKVATVKVVEEQA